MRTIRMNAALPPERVLQREIFVGFDSGRESGAMVKYALCAVKLCVNCSRKKSPRLV